MCHQEVEALAENRVPVVAGKGEKGIIGKNQRIVGLPGICKDHRHSRRLTSNDERAEVFPKTLDLDFGDFLLIRFFDYITRVIHEEPALAELFISHLLARNSRIEDDLVDQLFNSSEKRLARVLLLLANFGKEGRPEPVIAKISQETLAEMIGTTRSRVSFFMNKFRELGLIKYNGYIEVHTSLLNVVLHDEAQIRR